MFDIIESIQRILMNGKNYGTRQYWCAALDLRPWGRNVCAVRGVFWPQIGWFFLSGKLWWSLHIRRRCDSRSPVEAWNCRSYQTLYTLCFFLIHTHLWYSLIYKLGNYTKTFVLNIDLWFSTFFISWHNKLQKFCSMLKNILQKISIILLHSHWMDIVVLAVAILLLDNLMEKRLVP